MNCTVTKSKVFELFNVVGIVAVILHDLADNISHPSLRAPTRQRQTGPN